MACQVIYKGTAGGVEIVLYQDFVHRLHEMGWGIADALRCPGVLVQDPASGDSGLWNAVQVAGDFPEPRQDVMGMEIARIPDFLECLLNQG